MSQKDFTIDNVWPLRKWCFSLKIRKKQKSRMKDGLTIFPSSSSLRQLPDVAATLLGTWIEPCIDMSIAIKTWDDGQHQYDHFWLTRWTVPILYLEKQDNWFWILKKQHMKVTILMPLNFGIGEDAWDYCGQPRKQTKKIRKHISTKYSTEAQTIELKLSYFEYR